MRIPIFACCFFSQGSIGVIEDRAGIDTDANKGIDQTMETARGSTRPDILAFTSAHRCLCFNLEALFSVFPYS